MESRGSLWWQGGGHCSRRWRKRWFMGGSLRSRRWFMGGSLQRRGYVELPGARPGHGSPDPNNPTQPARKKTRPELRGGWARAVFFDPQQSTGRARAVIFDPKPDPTRKNPTQRPKNPTQPEKKPDPTRLRRVHGPTRPDPVIGTGRARAVLCDP
ncbi:hypothetical protein PVAP13_6NG015237 [Panicum virgatum]|uniref:Uncharacterized protein n=1 Tax=Panicum virgatum TaxID=38727 RepID=A0A8T0QT99_PANVG|nr:hypothetical protein PVAP13_6NG015237 [Panicum virgatum]